MDFGGLGGPSQQAWGWNYPPSTVYRNPVDPHALKDLNLYQDSFDTAHQTNNGRPLLRPRLPSIFGNSHALSDGNSRTEGPSIGSTRPPPQAMYMNDGPSKSTHTARSAVPTTYSTATTVGRRNISKSLDWEGHKPQIKQIYLDNDDTLPQTMRYMESYFDFKAS